MNKRFMELVLRLLRAILWRMTRDCNVNDYSTELHRDLMCETEDYIRDELS